MVDCGSVIFLEITEPHLTINNMNINKNRNSPQRELDRHIANGLTQEEATRLGQISHDPSRNGAREHREVTARLLKFRETLRLVDSTGIDELARATVRKDQWDIVEFYVFREVIQDLSKMDTLALAKYCLWVFHGMEVRPVIEAAPSKDTFGSLENVFGNIVID
ncbi:hypothetical protein H7X65_03955 [Candidatus Parcubacteria bacterium]|nr:hypothetical protein [Candidatus Parcubacteria bacterium]